MRYFVSGHLDLTLEEFREHYQARLRALDKNSDTVVVGDANGADAFAQAELGAIGFWGVTVYHMFVKPRINIMESPTKGGFTTDNERDAAMTAASDIDIAWVRPGREKSGTAKNIQRRFDVIGPVEED